MAGNTKYRVAKKFMVRETKEVFDIGQAANRFSKAKTEEYLEKGVIEVDKEATKAANDASKEAPRETAKAEVKESGKAKAEDKK